MIDRIELQRKLEKTCKSRWCSKGNFTDEVSELCDECFESLERIKLTKEVIYAIWEGK